MSVPYTTLLKHIPQEKKLRGGAHPNAPLPGYSTSLNFRLFYILFLCSLAESAYCVMIIDLESVL